MPQQSLNKTPLLFTVCYRPYDGSVQNDALLTKVRRSYFVNKKHEAGKTHSFTAGADIYIHYKIDKEKFSWRKVSGKMTLQEAFREKGGYFLLTRNLVGETVSKAHYSGGHLWLQTAYYSGDTAKPAALLKPNQDGSGLILLQFVPQTGKYTQSELEFCPIKNGTAIQSLINTVAGEPVMTVETDCGSFCCCSASEKESRMAVLNDLRLGAKNPTPDWPQEEDTAFNFNYIENDGSVAQPQPENPVVQAPVEPDYAANHEIFCTDEPAPEQPEEPVRYTVAVKGLDGQAQVSSFIPRHVERSTKQIVISAVESYTYFGKVIDGLRQGRGRTEMQSGHTAYEGEYYDDKRNGFGTYYYKSGKICYVGDWKGNKRDGVGVAYSSLDGSIFVGKWQDNIPTGSGAAFDENGGLIYTGEWKNGLRHGHGTEYQNGEIVFSGEFRADQYYSGYKHI